MSRRLSVTTIVIVIAVAVVIALSFTSDLKRTPVIAIIALVCVALAILALQHFVVGPALLEAAKQDARKVCEAGQIIAPPLYNKICDRLDRAPKDPEVVWLKTELKKLQDKK